MNINDHASKAQTFIFVVFVFICYRHVWLPILSMMNEREKKGLQMGWRLQKKNLMTPLEEAQACFSKRVRGCKKTKLAEIIEKATMLESYSSLLAMPNQKLKDELGKNNLPAGQKIWRMEINKTKT